MQGAARGLARQRDAAFIDVLKEGVEGNREAVFGGEGAKPDFSCVAVGFHPLDFIFPARRARALGFGATGKGILDDRPGGFRLAFFLRRWRRYAAGHAPSPLEG